MAFMVFLFKEKVLIMKDKVQAQIHTHKASDGTEYTHSHNEEHGHKHSHQNTKAVLNRLSRASGHLEAVRRMVEDGKDCSEVLIQLSAVIAALNNTGKVILSDHITNCIVDAVESGDKEAIDNLNKAIDRFIK
ncbi:metal-sensing transcriptional repressor [Aminipila terrae]